MDEHLIGKTGAAVTALGFGGAPAGNLYQETTGRGRHGGGGPGLGGRDPLLRHRAALRAGIVGAQARRRAAAPAARQLFVISTKVGRMLEPNPRPAGSDLAAGGFAVPDTLRRRFDFSAAAVRRSLEGSLGRLGLDRVDLVYVHDPDDHVDEAIAGAIPELIRMREEGLVSAVGVGMNQWQAPLRMVRETGIDLVMLAGRWTLLDRSGAAAARRVRGAGGGGGGRRAVQLRAAGPGLARRRGVLRLRAGHAGGAGPGAAPWPRICERHGVSLPDAAMQFPLRHPAVVSVVGGMAQRRAGCRRTWPASLPWCRTTRGRSLMPADGLLEVDLAYGRQGLRISLPADRDHGRRAGVPRRPRRMSRPRCARRCADPVAGPPLRARGPAGPAGRGVRLRRDPAAAAAGHAPRAAGRAGRHRRAGRPDRADRDRDAPRQHPGRAGARCSAPSWRPGCGSSTTTPATRACSTWCGEHGDGVPVWLNRHWAGADVRITTGFVEPHFFAGFSGGPKLVAPGLAGLETVLTLHDARRIGSEQATWGGVRGQPGARRRARDRRGDRGGLRASTSS